MTAYTLMNKKGELIGATSDGALARKVSEALDLELITWGDLGDELMASVEHIKEGLKHWRVELYIRTGEPPFVHVPASLCRCDTPWMSPLEFARIGTGLVGDRRNTFVTHVWAKHELDAVALAKKVRLAYFNLELYGG